VIDYTENSNGDLFIEFLTDINFAILNGRIGVNDFTYISPQGRSVVDYICVLYEQFEYISDFSVIKMLDLINSVNFNPISIPDHSLLTCEIKLPEKKRIKCDVSRNENVENINRKHKLNDIPDNFLSDTELLDSLQDTINRIENALNVNNSVQSAYDEFCVLVKDEMDNKLPIRSNSWNRNKRAKSMYKPYWNSTLQKQWDKVYASEKKWIKSHGSNAQKKNLKEKYCSERKCFDKLNRTYKRRYVVSEQEKLQDKLISSNQRDFWKSIGKLGIANERKETIPWSVLDDDGNLRTEKASVLERWKSDFENLLN